MTLTEQPATAAALSAPDLVYLRPPVKLEPLVCGWYAWIHLVSPLQQAMNLVFRHMPLLNSFIKSPAVHVSASRDPTMYGGPFVNLGAESVAEVRRLLEETQSRAARLIRLGTDFQAVDVALQQNARGHSLGDYYSKTPDSLAGLIEYLYDTNNHPRLRVHEELLYGEDLSAGTQEIMLSLVREKDRLFFMSTPRLRSTAASATFQLPFCDPRIDLLSAARTSATPLTELARALDVPDGNLANFTQFFTAVPPPRGAHEFQGEGVRVRYFGHACVLVQTARTNLLIDPMLAWENEHDDGRFTFLDLPDRIDYVILSHNHQDHCAPEMLLQLRHRVRQIVVPANNHGNVADPSMKLALRHLGYTNIVEMSPLETVSFADGTIMSLPFPGEHVDLDVHTRQGIALDVLGRRLVFLVDSDGRDPEVYRRISARCGRAVDALFVGMECHGAPLTWLYGPLLTKPISRRDDESRRLSGMDSQRAWKAVQQFDAARVFVYAMGQEPWLRYIMGLEYSPDSIQLKEVAAFLDLCRKAGIAAQNLFISHELVL